MAKVLSNDNFDETISNGITLVDFWATWCGPCKMIAPNVEEVATEFEGRAVVGKVDVDECPNIAMKYGVQSIPTLILFKDGELQERHVGFRAKSQLVDILNKYV